MASVPTQPEEMSEELGSAIQATLDGVLPGGPAVVSRRDRKCHRLDPRPDVR